MFPSAFFSRSFLAIALVVGFALAPLSPSPAAEAEAGVSLFADGTPVPVRLKGGTRDDLNAIQRVLVPYLNRMTGGQFTIKPWAEGEGEDGLLFEIAPTATGPVDPFHIVAGDGQVRISAPSRTGVFYGFYELLERLGCRFWSYNEELVPQRNPLVVPKMDYEWKPPFLIHDVMSREVQTGQNDFQNKSRGASPLRYSGGHTLYPLLTPYAEAHPEIYPLIRKKDKKTGAVISEGRAANQLHFCYLADGIAEALAAALEKEVAKHNGDLRNTIYFAGMGDWYGGQCQCEKCTKVYEEEAWTDEDGNVKPGYTATLLRMINKTAEILDAKYPGIKVGTFAYMGLEAPPAKTRPRENVIIQIPRIRHCGVHPAATCPKNRSFWLNLKRWCELAPGRTYIWEYGASFENFLYPVPMLRSIAQNVIDYQKLGVAGLVIQSNYVSTGGYAAVLHNYVWTHLMRDTQQPLEPLIASFIKDYYGPGAPYVEKYIAELEKSVGEPEPIHANEFTHPLKSYLTPEVLSRLKPILEAGRKKLASDQESDWYRRFEELELGVEATEYWREGPLGERDGKLIRLDFGYDTFPRALELRRYSRGATPREFGTAEGYWQNFLRWHGGPIRSLRQGELEVRAIPARGSSFGPVIAGERPLVVSSGVASVRYGVFEEGTPEDRIAMKGEGGIGAWSPNAKYVISNRVHLADGNRVENEIACQMVSKDPKEREKKVGIQTVYPIIPKYPNVEIAWRDEAGAWHTAAFPEPRKTVEVTGATAWRITSPRGVVTDEYQPLLGTGPFDGVLGLEAGTLRLYTEARFPISAVPFDAATPWVRRTLDVRPTAPNW